ncbi:hypothetical protein VB779_06755 [Haloarculaceae archaeon H-GB11]|nr:hypothetical protein [Haloarculaceae archaeon H-GB11]
MSQDHDTELDHWDVFADAQERATETLGYARSRYQELTNLSVLPDEIYATALGDAEEDVEKLDDVLDVSPDDATRAEAVADRTRLLADVLDAMWQFHTELIEVEISLYKTWYEGLSDLSGVDTSEVRDTISSLSAFVENENYGQLRSGDHFTVSRLREQLQEHDEAARESVDASAYVSYCLETAGAFEDGFTADLKQLVADDVSISIKTARKSVTETLDAARDAVKNEEVAEATAQLARVGMEGR